jgi:hypothetical protein
VTFGIPTRASSLPATSILPQFHRGSPGVRMQAVVPRPQAEAEQDCIRPRTGAERSEAQSASRPCPGANDRRELPRSPGKSEAVAGASDSESETRCALSPGGQE